MESQYLLSRREIMMGVKSKPEKAKYAGIPKQSEKKKAELKAGKPAKDNLNDWFKEIDNKECPGVSTTCWNCGEVILKPFMRAAIAHVLPKRKNLFPSVATHPMNYLILGAGCGCHNEYDRSWTDAAKMQVWKMAKERFKQISGSIAKDEKSKIPEQFK
jgi:hypothetical protein